MRLDLTVEATPKDFAERFEKLPENLQALVNVVHRACVFQCLEAMLLWLRVDTGRLRGSFLPFMAKYQFPYQRAITTKSSNKNYSLASLAEGMDLGSFVDAFLDTTIQTNVEYAQILDDKSGMFDMEAKSSLRPAPISNLPSATMVFEEFFGRNFDQYLNGQSSQMLSFDAFMEDVTRVAKSGNLMFDFGQPA